MPVLAETYYVVKCDNCPARLRVPSETSADARAKAVRLGWKVKQAELYCTKCLEKSDIKEYLNP